MKTKKTIKQGLGLAAGVLAGNAFVVPMISGGNVPQGIIVAALVLAVFSVIALCQSDKSCGIQKEP